MLRFGQEGFEVIEAYSQDHFERACVECANHLERGDRAISMFYNSHFRGVQLMGLV